MSEIWYKIGGWGKGQIKKVDVDRETEQCLFIKGRRTNKRGVYENYFKTFDEAKEYLVGEARREHESAVRKLRYAEEALVLAESIEPFRQN